VERSASLANPPDIRLVRTARLIALTDQARDAIRGDFLVITRFPFKVGRESRTMLSKLSMSLERRLGTSPQLNDVYIDERDHVVHVSREHFLIDVTDEGFILVDRGSMCGTIVAGRRVGGDRTGGWVALRDQDVVIAGAASSPYVFRFRTS
jgi:hypothetical protein